MSQSTKAKLLKFAGYFGLAVLVFVLMRAKKASDASGGKISFMDVAQADLKAMFTS